MHRIYKHVVIIIAYQYQRNRANPAIPNAVKKCKICVSNRNPRTSESLLKTFRSHINFCVIPK